MTLHRTIRLLLSTAAVLNVVSLAPSALADNGGLPMAEPESVGMSSERLERIGVGMRRLIDDDKIPGTVSLVARRGKVVPPSRRTGCATSRPDSRWSTTRSSGSTRRARSSPGPP